MRDASEGNWSSPLSPSNGGEEEEENGWDFCQGRMQPTLESNRERKVKEREGGIKQGNKLFEYIYTEEKEEEEEDKSLMNRNEKRDVGV